METGELKSLPLADLHQQAGAKFGGFAGWSMPLAYPLGVMKEHLHTRAAAGLFDISHMRLFTVHGPEAAQFLAAVCPIEPAALTLGQSKYTLLLDENAGIIDDLIITRQAPHHFLIVANAGNAADDETHLRAHIGRFDCSLRVLDRVFLALQGPQAEAALKRADIGVLPRIFMHSTEPRADWFVSRSGYTGEDGFEIATSETEARRLVKALLEDDAVEWIGLAARDSLRLEAGLCLHGQDITRETNPVDAGLLWAIPKTARDMGSFVGADPLREKIAAGPSRKRVGLKPDGRQPVRAGATIIDGDGVTVGTVTSGGFGPSAGHPVAMGYVDADHARPGTRLFAEIRGSRIPLDVHSLPFTQHRYRKG